MDVFEPYTSTVTVSVTLPDERHVIHNVMYHPSQHCSCL